jgi:hypothetical protein
MAASHLLALLSYNGISLSEGYEALLPSIFSNRETCKLSDLIDRVLELCPDSERQEVEKLFVSVFLQQPPQREEDAIITIPLHDEITEERWIREMTTLAKNPTVRDEVRARLQLVAPAHYALFSIGELLAKNSQNKDDVESLGEGFDKIFGMNAGSVTLSTFVHRLAPSLPGVTVKNLQDAFAEIDPQDRGKIDREGWCRTLRSVMLTFDLEVEDDLESWEDEEMEEEEEGEEEEEQDEQADEINRIVNQLSFPPPSIGILSTSSVSSAAAVHNDDDLVEITEEEGGDDSFASSPLSHKSASPPPKYISKQQHLLSAAAAASDRVVMAAELPIGISSEPSTPDFTLDEFEARRQPKLDLSLSSSEHEHKPIVSRLISLDSENLLHATASSALSNSPSIKIKLGSPSIVEEVEKIPLGARRRARLSDSSPGTTPPTLDPKLVTKSHHSSSSNSHSRPHGSKSPKSPNFPSASTPSIHHHRSPRRSRSSSASVTSLSNSDGSGSREDVRKHIAHVLTRIVCLCTYNQMSVCQVFELLAGSTTHRISLDLFVEQLGLV